MILNSKAGKSQPKMTKNKNIFDSVTYQIPSPSGDVNVIIVEDSPGNIYMVTILVGKSGSEVRAMCDALSRMITSSLKIKSLTEVIDELSSITSDKFRDMRGIKVRSIPEAVFVALHRYSNMYPTYTDRGNDMEYRPAKFTNLNRD